MNTETTGRRAFLVNGGAIAAAGILLAACGGDEGAPARIGLAPATTDLPEVHVSDLVLVRTAQSVELVAVAALGNAAVTSKADPATKAAMEVYVGAHKANVAALSPLVEARGGSDVTSANARMMANYVETAAELISSSDSPEDDVRTFVHALESVVAATYQAFVAWANDPALRSALMSLAVGPSQFAAAAALLISPGAKGITPVTDADGVVSVAALPGAFGPLTSFPATLGKPNDAGARETISLETPSLNSLVY